MYGKNQSKNNLTIIHEELNNRNHGLSISNVKANSS